MAIEDLTGQEFGKWTVVKLGESRPRKGGTIIYWTCQCECGTVKDVQSQSLRNGRSSGCVTCHAKQSRKRSDEYSPKENEIGKRYGNWTVVEYSGFRRVGKYGKNVLYKCRCDCGNVVDVQIGHLRSGSSKSCINCRSHFGEQNPNYSHGHCTEVSASPTYRTWAGIYSRCTNQKSIVWNYYGGAGIKMCQGWRTFANFLSDMGERPDGHVIDRLNDSAKTRHYSCGKCDQCKRNGWVMHARWVSRSESNYNKAGCRTMTTGDGQSLTLPQIAAKAGIPFDEFMRVIRDEQ